MQCMMGELEIDLYFKYCNSVVDRPGERSPEKDCCR